MLNKTHGKFYEWILWYFMQIVEDSGFGVLLFVNTMPLRRDRHIKALQV
jgi:hypothetical protein